MVTELLRRTLEFWACSPSSEYLSTCLLFHAFDNNCKHAILVCNLLFSNYLLYKYKKNHNVKSNFGQMSKNQPGLTDRFNGHKVHVHITTPYVALFGGWEEVFVGSGEFCWSHLALPPLRLSAGLCCREPKEMIYLKIKSLLSCGKISPCSSRRF